jgi:hypothetical protein
VHDDEAVEEEDDDDEVFHGEEQVGVTHHSVPAKQTRNQVSRNVNCFVTDQFCLVSFAKHWFQRESL